MSTRGMPQFKTVAELVSGLILQCTGTKLDIGSLTALNIEILVDTSVRDSLLKLISVQLNNSFQEGKVTLTLQYGPSQNEIMQDFSKKMGAIRDQALGLNERLKKSE